MFDMYAKDGINKEEVFLRVLSMYEAAERTVNKYISGNDEKLIEYGLNKIDLIVKQLAKEYREAKA